MPYCFSKSSVKFQGHKALKIVEFDPDCGFPDCNSSLNSPMPMKCCTKLEVAEKSCPIVFEGHRSNFKVTRLKRSSIFNSPMAKKWCKKLKVAEKRCPIFFFFLGGGSSIKFQGHMGWKIDDLNPVWVRLLGRLQLSNPWDLPCSCLYVKF